MAYSLWVGINHVSSQGRVVVWCAVSNPEFSLDCPSSARKAHGSLGRAWAGALT